MLSRLQQVGSKQQLSRSLRAFSSTSAACHSMPPFDHQPKPYDGPSIETVKELRAKHLNPSMFIYYKQPIMLVEGKMQYVYDHEGKRYLDLFGGIVTTSVGHSHPVVTKAVQEQVDKIVHTTTIYLNPNIAQYAEKLTEKLPGDLSVAYFVNSGSEANDMAMLMSRVYTGRWTYCAMRNGYHGMSAGAMGLTSLHTWKYDVPHGDGILHTMNADKYRGVFGNDGMKYAEQLEDAIKFSTSGGVAGFIAEPIQGVGGTVEYADGFLPAAYDVVRKYGGLCIADEVQTGFGRVGTHFWGFEQQGLSPDIVVMAKSIGNGFPLAAVVTTPEIAKTLSTRINFNTYGGNPVSTLVGMTVLDLIEKEGLQQNCLERGDQLKKGMNALKDKYSVVGDVRGQGLMLGLEFVKDRDTKEPATEATGHVFEHLKENGILIGKGGLNGNVLRIKPPMCVTSDDMEFFLHHLEEAIKTI